MLSRLLFSPTSKLLHVSSLSRYIISDQVIFLHDYEMHNLVQNLALRFIYLLYYNHVSWVAISVLFLHCTIFYKTWLSFWPSATTQTTRGLSTSKNLRWDFKSLIINKWCSKKLRIPHHVGICMRWIIIRKQNIHKIFAHCKYVLLSPVSCCQVLKATSCSNSCYVKE